ncbi:MAG: hypothetical protein ACMUHY_04295, partial [Thermoplasmatota archaeon]
YRAFDMNNGDDVNITIVLSLLWNGSEPVEHDTVIEFLFLPYSFHLRSFEISPNAVMEGGEYVLEHGRIYTFDLLVRREGGEMLLPDPLTGPVLVLLVDHIERKRVTIPLIDPGNETIVKLGPIEVLFTGDHFIEFAIIGMGAQGQEGDPSIGINVHVDTPGNEADGKDHRSEAAIAAISLSLLLFMVLIGAAIYVFMRGVSFGESDPGEE